MPTAKKEQDISALEKRISESTIAIATDYSGMSVTDMTELRRVLRGQGVDYRVVKNTLTYLAADSAGKPQFKEVVQGPTGVAFGYGEVTEPAKALTDFIRSTRSALKIRGAVMGERTLTPVEVEVLGRLPSKDVLIARLAGQLQGGIAGLVYVLSAPISGLATVLQRHIESDPTTGAEPDPDAAPPEETHEVHEGDEADEMAAEDPEVAHEGESDELTPDGDEAEPDAAASGEDDEDSKENSEKN